MNLTKRKLAEYYYHNEYNFHQSFAEMQKQFPDITKDWLKEVWDELEGDYDPPF